MEDAEQVESWIAFHGEHFPQRVASTGHQLTLPERKEGLEKLIVVPEGITMREVVIQLRRQRPTKGTIFTVTDRLDRYFPNVARRAERSYAVRHCGGEEPDMLGLSVEDVEEKETPTLTLLEYLLFSMKHFEDTGRRLDATNITLFPGTRRKDECVAGADTAKGPFVINWTLAGRKPNKHMGFREAGL